MAGGPQARQAPIIVPSPYPLACKETHMPKAKANAKASAETVSGYFRRLFQENPKLLDGRSNEELLGRWLKDHPGEKEVPERIKNSLANVKSVLRTRERKTARK